MIEVKSKKVTGYSLIELIIVIGVLSVLISAFASAIHEWSLKAHARGQVANQLANVSNAVRVRLSSENAVSEFPSATQNRNGLNWLKGPSCAGGASPVDILPCNIPNVIPKTGGLRFYTQITNSGGNLSASITVRNSSGAGYSTGQGLRQDLAGLASRFAMGGAKLNGAASPSSVSSFSTFESHPSTGIITISVDTDPTNQPYLRVDGQNDMNADLDFSGLGHDINNVNDVNAQRFVDIDNGNIVDPSQTSTLRHARVTNDFRAKYLRDLDNPNYIVDPSGTSTLNTARARRMSATNAAFNAANIGSLNADEISATSVQSDIALSRVFFDKDNPNFYLDLEGTSRVRDMYLASRGNARLSELLPNWVLKESILTTSASATITKPNCGVSGTEALVIVPQSSRFNVDDGVATDKRSAMIFRATDNGGSWRMVCETPNNTSGALTDTQCDALAHLYCVYP